MNDTAEQQIERVEQALHTSGFENTLQEGLFFKSYGATGKIIVNLAAATISYWNPRIEYMEDMNGNVVPIGSEDPALAAIGDNQVINSVVKLIENAKKGIMS